MDMNKTDANTNCSRESGHDTRGRPQQHSPCGGHILVLCIVPYEWCVGWVKMSKRLTKTLSDAPPRASDCNRDATGAFAAAKVRLLNHQSNRCIQRPRSYTKSVN